MTYALITAAKNEEDYILKTLNAVVSQTIIPKKWVIISDGSTDRTDTIVADFASHFHFIEFIRRESSGGRNFGSKAKAINFGYQIIKNMDLEFIGILDADVSFPKNYYERLLPKFEIDHRLGIAGGFVLDKDNDRWVRKKLSCGFSVRGPIQFFRRECWDQIGGYKVLPYGGVDSVAESTARMYGWSVNTFLDIEEVWHHRPTGTEKQDIMSAKIKLGKQARVNGYHPLFMFFRVLNQIPETPFLVGAWGLFWGFLIASLKREPFAVSHELVDFLRKEQVRRLFNRVRPEQV